MAQCEVSSFGLPLSIWEMEEIDTFVNVYILFTRYDANVYWLKAFYRYHVRKMAFVVT